MNLDFGNFKTQCRHYYPASEYYLIKRAFYHGNSIQTLTPVSLSPLFQTTVNHEQRYRHRCVSTSNNAINTREITATMSMMAFVDSIINNDGMCRLDNGNYESSIVTLRDERAEALVYSILKELEMQLNSNGVCGFDTQQ